jgi:hypothetical protein
MIKYVAVTSMNEKYYDICGRAMLRSYKKYWSHIIPLYVYNEDDFTIKIDTIKPMGWNLGKEYQKFQERHTNEKVKKFSKKGFSIIHAMDNIEADRIIWLDADVILKRTMHLQLLDLISDESTLSTHYSVWHENNDTIYHSCETGFFILNKNHTGFNDFRATYKNIYYNDVTAGLRRFYDGEIYGKTVEIMQDKEHKMINLNPSRHKTPISRSLLDPYLTHFKAGLKDRVNFSTFDQDDNE